jgi:ABC-type lipoprotein export system ATPase subunit
LATLHNATWTVAGGRGIVPIQMSLTVDGLHFSYTQAPLISGFHLHVPIGQPTLLKGESGSGKTTLLKLCAGLLPPAAGEIKLAGTVLAAGEESGRAWRRDHAAYLDQENSLVQAWSVRENLNLANADEKAQKKILNKFDLGDRWDALVSTLSGGEKQRVAVARLILRPLPLALVDEPTSHLDDVHTGLVMRELIESFRASTLLIVSHDRRVEDHVAKVVPWKGRGHGRA